MNQKNKVFELKKKIKETIDVITLKFIPYDGKIYDFIPGQFVMISFLNNQLSNISKAYTISSFPREKYLSITVKKIGRFSGALHNLKINDKVLISEPQGFFCLDYGNDDCIFLAGGMGITPFYSIIKSCLHNNNNRNIYLFYSNKTKKDIIFLKELEKLSSQLKNFKIIHCLTRDTGETIYNKNDRGFALNFSQQAAKNLNIKHSKNIEFQRINCDIIKKYLKTLEQKHFFICGPIMFVNDLWKELKNNRVKEKNIFTEAFY